MKEISKCQQLNSDFLTRISDLRAVKAATQNPPKARVRVARTVLFICEGIWGVAPVGLCLGVNVYKSDVCIQQLDDDFVLLLFYILFVSSLYILAKLRPRLKLEA